MGFTQRLIKKLGGRLEPQYLDALQTVDRNARHLLGLINDVLDLSKIEAGRMELRTTEFPLLQAVREVTGQTASLLDGRPLELVLDLPEDEITILADRIKLVQILTNLVSNGIKYTERGRVTVTVRADHDDVLGSVARIEVSDTGMGIKAEDLPRLFTKFSQLETGTARPVGGTGLGLFITARYVEMREGRIDVRSEFGKGSTFTVLFPIQAAVSADSAPHREPGPPAAPRGDALQPAAPGPLTVLCVDDDPDAVRLLEATFDGAGYRTAAASGYEEALARAAAVKPDLICLDLGMPGKDGFAVIAALRQDETLRDVPIVVVSGRSDAPRAVECGARCCLAKPIVAEELLAVAREVLGSRVGSVLVVEDDPDTARLVADSLSENGMQVRTAANGLEALVALECFRPTVIVLDLEMPIMDGFDFLRGLRRNRIWEDVPVVVLSVTTPAAEHARFLHDECECVITKGRADTATIVQAVLDAALSGGRKRAEPALA
jgi:CheY-like chemotaxis protein